MPKVFLRTLLYSTAKHGQIVESMYVKLRRAESVQTFNIGVYGDKPLARGSGLFVGYEGIACNHHFLLPKDGTQYDFLAGDYAIEVYAFLVNKRTPLLLYQLHVSVSKQDAEVLQDKASGIYFDWGPDSKKYHSHIDKRPSV